MLFNPEAEFWLQMFYSRHFKSEGLTLTWKIAGSQTLGFTRSYM